jgi:predicted phage baseplate assembly protein
MSLVPPILDDRRFDNLRSEALERVQRLCPEWTDFNASDPGITLLELFAWFTELMLFRMNQVPDKLHGELLNLVNLKPESAKPARALIEFQLSEGSKPPAVILARTGSNPITLDGGQVVTFETERDLALVRGPVIAIVRKLSDRDEEDLTKLNELVERGYDPFGPAGEPASELRLRIKVAKEDRVADVLPEVVTLHVTRAERAGHGGVPLPDSAKLAVRPAAPPLGGEVRVTGEGGEDIWEPVQVIEDESRGFERDGLIRLRRPRRASAIPQAKDKNAPASPAYAFELRCRVGGGGYAFGRAPRLQHLAFNAVYAVAQATEKEDSLGASTGMQAQSFNLRNRPVEPKSVTLVTRQNDDRSTDTPWEEVADFSKAGRADKVYVLDAAEGRIKFGDGLRGMVPPAGHRIVATSYRAGGGANGNVKAKAITFTLSGLAGTNPFPARNGTDAEPDAALRQRAAARLRSRDRAVTGADFEELAKSKGGMPRAKAIAGLHPDFPELECKMPGAVTVFVVAPLRPGNAAPPWPADADLDHVQATLDRHRMIGVELFVQAARIVPVKVIVTAVPVAGNPLDDVARVVRDSLNNWLNSTDRGFGTELYGADLWSCVMQAKVGSAAAVQQITRLTAEVSGHGTIRLGMERDESGKPKLLGFGKSDEIAIRIPNHAVLWGRPDHEFVVDRSGP